jgi:hypothetical protein
MRGAENRPCRWVESPDLLGRPVGRPDRAAACRHADRARLPRGVLSLTRQATVFVAGSTRATVPSNWLPTQTAPSPMATPHGRPPTLIRATMAPVAGSSRRACRRSSPRRSGSLSPRCTAIRRRGWSGPRAESDGRRTREQRSFGSFGLSGRRPAPGACGVRVGGWVCIGCDSGGAVCGRSRNENGSRQNEGRPRARRTGTSASGLSCAGARGYAGRLAAPLPLAKGRGPSPAEAPALAARQVSANDENPSHPHP